MATTTTTLTLTNPGAEAGDGSGWTSLIGSLSVKSSSPSPNSGSYYFYGGSNGYVYVYQDIDLEAAGIPTNAIDNGDAAATVEWYQSSAAGDDDARMTLFFLDGDGYTVGDDGYSSSYSSPTSWTSKSHTVDPIPDNARTIRIRIDMVRNDGTTLDAYIDDISCDIEYPTPQIDADPGSYVITGTDATLRLNYLDAEAGSYAITGTDADMAEADAMSVTPGAYILVGTDADIYDPDLLVFEEFPVGVIKYTFTLTGAADGLEDIDMPISNFQARKRSGAPSYLSVTIPTFDYADQITARPNGTLKITLEVIRNNVPVLNSVIADADFDNIIEYEGTSSKSLVLSGNKTESFVQKSIEIEKASYVQTSDGYYRYRLSEPNIYVNPNDEVTIDGNTFTVDELTYSVSTSGQTIEIAEAA